MHRDPPRRYDAGAAAAGSAAAGTAGNGDARHLRQGFHVHADLVRTEAETVAVVVARQEKQRGKRERREFAHAAGCKIGNTRFIFHGSRVSVYNGKYL